MKYKIYLDDIRNPKEDDWIVVRNYYDFVEKIHEIGLQNIDLISLDHDLDTSAMKEFMDGNGIINYDNIKEKTGLDAAKFLVNLSMDTKTPLPQINVHSFNPAGSKNIISYINNYLRVCNLKETCVRIFNYKKDGN